MKGWPWKREDLGNNGRSLTLSRQPSVRHSDRTAGRCTCPKLCPSSPWFEQSYELKAYPRDKRLLGIRGSCHQSWRILALWLDAGYAAWVSTDDEASQPAACKVGCTHTPPFLPKPGPYNPTGPLVAQLSNHRRYSRRLSANHITRC